MTRFAGKRKVGKIESDLDRVRAIRHPHLLSLYGARLTRYTSAFFPVNPYSHPAIRSTEGWSLIVLSETNPGQSLEDLLGTIGELRPERAITYFAQLVSAVECLHTANIIHKAIKPRAISLGKTGVGVKLGEVAWFQRLVDLNKAEQWVMPPLDHDLPDSWYGLVALFRFLQLTSFPLCPRTCPEVVEEPFLYDRSRDMYVCRVLTRCPSRSHGSAQVGSRRRLRSNGFWPRCLPPLRLTIRFGPSKCVIHRDGSLAVENTSLTVTELTVNRLPL